MKLEHVPVDYVYTVWPDVAGFIEASITQGGTHEYTLEQAKSLLGLGLWRLIVATEETAVKGAMIVVMQNRPNQRVFFVQSVGGEGILHAACFEQLKQIAVQWGATTIQCAARPAVQRLLRPLGLVEQYTILGLTL